MRWDPTVQLGCGRRQNRRPVGAIARRAPGTPGDRSSPHGRRRLLRPAVNFAAVAPRGAARASPAGHGHRGRPDRLLRRSGRLTHPRPGGRHRQHRGICTTVARTASRVRRTRSTAIWSQPWIATSSWVVITLRPQRPSASTATRSSTDSGGSPPCRVTTLRTPKPGSTCSLQPAAWWTLAALQSST